MLSALVIVAVTAAASPDAAAPHTGHLAEIRLPAARSLWVPPGTFTFGASSEEKAIALTLCKRELEGLDQVDRVCTAELFKDEGPAQIMFLPGYYLDREEVSVAAYRRCVEAGRCDPRPLFESDPRLIEPRLPITNVSWFDADRYCTFAGGSLPTELQWERAARGPTHRVFPWGDAPHADHSNHGRFQVVNAVQPIVRVDETDGYALLAPPGSYPAGASPEGFVDMAGNAMEWIQDSVGEEGPVRSLTGAPIPIAGARRMLRGGSFRQPLLYHRSTAWEAAAPELRSSEVGFRCASERAIEPR